MARGDSPGSHHAVTVVVRMFLLDSNILIYATQPQHVLLQDWLTKQQRLCISAISHIEVLGYHKLQKGEKQALSTSLSCF